MRTFIIRHQKLSGWLLILALTFAGVFIAMQISTNEVMAEIEQAFRCPDAYIMQSSYDPINYPEKYAIPGMNYILYDGSARNPSFDLFRKFNITRRIIEWELGNNLTTEISVRRRFAWHNFHLGMLYFDYNVEIIDSDGKTVFQMDNSRTPVEVTIQKKRDGHWRILQAYEHP